MIMATTDVQSTGKSLGELGNAISAFIGMIITTAVDFGLPLSDAQQVDIMYLVIMGIALYQAIYTARHNTTVARAITRTRKIKPNDEPPR